MNHHYHHHHHHHHHLSLYHEGRWGTTNDFTTIFLHLSLFSTALWDFSNSRPVHSQACQHKVGPRSRAPKKNTSHGNEVLPQDTAHLIQRPCYQRGSTCQDPAGNRARRKPPDDCKKTQTPVVWSCLPFIKSSQNPLARHGKGGRRQGRQRKRLEDSIREWTGLEFAKSQRAMENRKERRKLVAKSSVVPQRPSRLRDK